MSTGLELARIKRAEMTAAGIKVVVLSPTEKARRNKASLRLAINGACWSCCGEGADGWKHTRETIQLCTASETCSLWPVRPYQRNNEVDDDVEAVEVDAA